MWSRILLLKPHKGWLRFPKGLAPKGKTKVVFDRLRKWRDGSANPTKSTRSRMREGKDGLAGLRLSELMDTQNYREFIDWTGSCLEDFTGLPKYANIVKRVDKEILRIAESGTQPESEHSHVPESLVEGVRQSTPNKNIERKGCLCFLYSLALFDANPNLMAEPFREVVYRNDCNLQRSLTLLLRQRISQVMTIQAFAKKMFPHQADPLKSFENVLYDPKRIIQPLFIEKFAKTYYDSVLDENKKSDELNEMLPTIWNFTIRSVVIMDKIREKFDLDFREIAKTHYDEFRKYADLAWQDFS